MLLQYGIIFVVHCAVTLAGSENSGFYRCMWFGSGGSVTTQRSMTSGHVQTRMCFRSDSEKMTSYINYCTGQHFSPLRACHDNGTWSCDSFVSFCKSVVLSEPRIPEVIQPKPQQQQTSRTQDTWSGGSGSPSVCPPASSYFSLKEMAVAVLVSFISGAALLTIFIIVIWRYRHTKWESQWKEQNQQKVQRMAALHAITQIAHAFGSSSDIEHASSFNNPNYAQVIASNMVLDDVLSETDRVYEEISNRRKSSAKPTTSDNLYTKVSVAKAKILKTMSIASDLSNLSEDAHTYSISGFVSDADEKTKMDEVSTVTSKCDSGYIDEVCDSAKEKLDTSMEQDKSETKEAVPNATEYAVYENSKKMSFQF